MNKLNKLTTEMLFFKSENKDVNYLEGGGVFIEDPHLTEIFSIITKRIVELEKRVDAISKAK